MTLFVVFPLGARASTGPGVAGPAMRVSESPDRSVHDGSGALIEGVVLDALTLEPVPNVAVSLIDIGITRSTNLDGQFRFAGIATGTHRVGARHVAYLPDTVSVSIREAGQRARMTIRLDRRTYMLGEVVAEPPPLTPQTSGDRASYSIHPAVLHDLAADRLVDIVKLLPGVTVSGDRPFFRGVGFEQVLPIIDGVPIREPIEGRWVLPPPQAISTAELVSEAFGAEYASVLGSAMSFQLSEGSSQTAARASYRTDRLRITGDPSRRSDNAELALSGPSGLPSVYYSASWQGFASDTYLAYDHSLPEQKMFGALSIGSRMTGSEATSFKLTFRRPDSRMKLSASLIRARDRDKNYYDHYSRAGWVGYLPAYGRYTTFLQHPSDADSAVTFDGPDAVPTSEATSTMAMVIWSFRPSPGSSVRVHALSGRHSTNTSISGVDLATDDDLYNWTRFGITSPNHQEEWFYATHGSLPEYTRARSREGQVGASASLRITDAHRLKIGTGVRQGRHRYASVTQAGVVNGSIERSLDATDAFGYIEETWANDRLSSMTIGTRYDYRRVEIHGRSWSGATWSPSIAFHQPMTERDAFHAQAGITYQFPILQPYFSKILDSNYGIDLNAQRLRFYEVGVQHHITNRMVASLGLYQREYAKIVFSSRTPSALEAAFGVRTLPPQFLDTMGLEAVLDHQFSSRLLGQASLVWSNTTNNGVEVPWSRRLYARSWMSWNAGRGVLATLTAAWDTGRPYSICIKPRGCTESQLIKGTLPQPFTIDMAMRWGPRTGRAPLRLLAEVRNLLDRRIPTFDFGVHPMRIGSGNFLAYYDETGGTGGYIVDTGDSRVVTQVNNPQTRTAGRQVLLGIEVEFSGRP
jgi:hypothetical protein